MTKNRHHCAREKPISAQITKGVCSYCTLIGKTSGPFPFVIHATHSIVNPPPEQSRSSRFLNCNLAPRQIVPYCSRYISSIVSVLIMGAFEVRTILLSTDFTPDYCPYSHPHPDLWPRIIDTSMYISSSLKVNQLFNFQVCFSSVLFPACYAYCYSHVTVGCC